MATTNFTINELTEDEFAKTFDLVDGILSQYDLENNDDYILLISHLITILQTIKSVGDPAFTEMINNPKTYISKAL